MRLSETMLRKIIREEAANLVEMRHISPYAGGSGKIPGFGEYPDREEDVMYIGGMPVDKSKISGLRMMRAIQEGEASLQDFISEFGIEGVEEKLGDVPLPE